MSQPPPIVYLLHGDDEFAIGKFVDELEAKLGDPSLAAMNVTRLDGRTFNPAELLSIAGNLPFLAKRRIVILTYPLTRLTTPEARQNFLVQLEKLPPTTALLLVEDHPLTDERDRKKDKLHWLERWAVDSPDRTYIKLFMQPKGLAMRQWILERAIASGGQFTPQAADSLSVLVGADTLLASQEIEKLLTYVNARRPVEAEDVQLLTADTAERSIFALVDALGSRQGRQAVNLLQHLLEQREAVDIFFMVVRQFRLLLLARDVLDRGGTDQDIAKVLSAEPFKVNYYVAEKVISRQARQFSIQTLEFMVHRLLELESTKKNFQLEYDLALDTLVAELMLQPR